MIIDNDTFVTFINLLKKSEKIIDDFSIKDGKFGLYTPSQTSVLFGEFIKTKFSIKISNIKTFVSSFSIADIKNETIEFLYNGDENITEDSDSVIFYRFKIGKKVFEFKKPNITWTPEVDISRMKVNNNVYVSKFNIDKKEFSNILNLIFNVYKSKAIDFTIAEDKVILSSVSADYSQSMSIEIDAEINKDFLNRKITFTTPEFSTLFLTKDDEIEFVIHPANNNMFVLLSSVDIKNDEDELILNTGSVNIGSEDTEN